MKWVEIGPDFFVRPEHVCLIRAAADDEKNDGVQSVIFLIDGGHFYSKLPPRKAKEMLGAPQNPLSEPLVK